MHSMYKEIHLGKHSALIRFYISNNTLFDVSVNN